MAFGNDIKRLRAEAGISVEKLSSKLNVDAARMRKWEQKNSIPRYEDKMNIEKFFGMSLEEIGKLNSIKNYLEVPNIENADKAIRNKKEEKQQVETALKNVVNTDSLEKQTLKSIADSNKVLADSNKILAEAHLKLVDANVSLTQMVKKTVIEDGVLGIPEVLLPRFQAVLQLIAKAGSKGWDSEDHAIEEISRSFYADLKVKKKGRSPVGVSR